MTIIGVENQYSNTIKQLHNSETFNKNKKSENINYRRNYCLAFRGKVTESSARKHVKNKISKISTEDYLKINVVISVNTFILKIETCLE